MRTQGIEVHHGYLVHKGANDTPEPFWSRLKHAASKAQRLDELDADYGGWDNEPKGTRRIMSEHVVFRRWACELFGSVERWPWEGGWSPDRVDAYLTSDGRGG